MAATFLACLQLAAAVASAQLAPPTVGALSVVVMDGDSGRILYSKNGNLPLPPASTTKIMTGLLLAEKCKPDEILTAPSDVVDVRESSMHLVPGEQLKAEELLYGIMLRSANDGCHMVACHISGSEAEFAKLMNQRAKDIGCTNTTFVNPHGLNNPQHLTTAHDLALMAREAMKNPLFATVVGTKKRVIERSTNLKDILMVSRDKWLSLDTSARGVKTGFTKEAGHCFVGCSKRGDMTVITAILKSDTWLPDQVALTDWAYTNFEPKTLYKKGEVVATGKVQDGLNQEVGLLAERDVKGVVAKTGNEGHELLLDEAPVQAPFGKGDVVKTGAIRFAYGTQIEFRLTASESVEKKPHLVASMMNPFTIAGFLIMGGGAMWMRARSRRMAQLDWSRR